MSSMAMRDPYYGKDLYGYAKYISTLSESLTLINEENIVTSTPKIVDTSKLDITIFDAILQEAEVPNRNNRVYSKKAITEALARPIILEKLKKKTFYGEAGHPEELPQQTEKEKVKRQTRIEMTNITHVITKMWWIDNLLWGRVETLNTRLGRDFSGLIRQGCGVSFSMRGLGGNVKNKNGLEYVDDGLYIVCYDNVPIPSHEPAYIQNVLQEDYNIFNLNNNHPIKNAKYENIKTESLMDIVNEGLNKHNNVMYNNKHIVDSFLSNRFN